MPPRRPRAPPRAMRGGPRGGRSPVRRARPPPRRPPPLAPAPASPPAQPTMVSRDDQEQTQRLREIMQKKMQVWNGMVMSHSEAERKRAFENFRRLTDEEIATVFRSVSKLDLKRFIDEKLRIFGDIVTNRSIPEKKRSLKEFRDIGEEEFGAVEKLAEQLSNVCFDGRHEDDDEDDGGGEEDYSEKEYQRASTSRRRRAKARGRGKKYRSLEGGMSPSREELFKQMKQVRDDCGCMRQQSNPMIEDAKYRLKEIANREMYLMKQLENFSRPPPPPPPRTYSGPLRERMMQLNMEKMALIETILTNKDAGSKPDTKIVLELVAPAMMPFGAPAMYPQAQLVECPAAAMGPPPEPKTSTSILTSMTVLVDDDGKMALLEEPKIIQQ